MLGRRIPPEKLLHTQTSASGRLLPLVNGGSGSRLCENTQDASKTEFHLDCLCNQQAGALIAPRGNTGPCNVSAPNSHSGRSSGWIPPLIASSGPKMSKDAHHLPSAYRLDSTCNFRVYIEIASSHKYKGAFYCLLRAPRGISTTIFYDPSK